MNEKKLYEQMIKELISISQLSGCSPDLVQGGSGNTSVKLDDIYMAVKASGCKLNEITMHEGFVIVNYNNIREQINSRDIDEELVKDNILKSYNTKGYKPSIETGFHSFLQKYVIHTHPVYANIICCSKEGRMLIREIFKNKKDILHIPYVNPGMELALKLKQDIEEYNNKYGVIPGVIFMQNHGLIVNSSNIDECIKLNHDIIERLKEYFDIDDKYPDIRLNQIDEYIFRSENTYLLSNVFQKSIDFLNKNVIFIDQLIRLSGRISLDPKKPDKVTIDMSKGTIFYSTNYDEARSLDETMTAFLYIVQAINKLGLTLETIPQAVFDSIKHIEGKSN